MIYDCNFAGPLRSGNYILDSLNVAAAANEPDALGKHRESERLRCGGVGALNCFPFSANPASLGDNPPFPRMQAGSAHPLMPLPYGGLNSRRVGLYGAVFKVEEWVNAGGSQHPTQGQAENAQAVQSSFIQKPYPADQDRENKHS